MKEATNSVPLWLRLVAVSGVLVLFGTAAVFPKLGQIGPDVGAQAVTSLHVNVKPTRSEVAWVFRSYEKITPSPERFLMAGPTLREKPLG